jgi:hypothetical protein
MAYVLKFLNSTGTQDNIPLEATTGNSATGALTGQASAVAGSAERSHVFTATGDIIATDAAVAGTASRTHVFTSTGDLSASGAAIAGTADHAATGSHDATGTLTSTSSTVAGAATLYVLHTSTGAIAADSAVIAGSAARLAAAVTHEAAGALQADSAIVAGESQNGTVTPVGKPKIIWAKKAKIADIPAEGKQEIKAVVKQLATADVEQKSVAEVYQSYRQRKKIQPPRIESPEPAIVNYAEQYYRQAVIRALVQRIEEIEQDEEESLMALLL